MDTATAVWVDLRNERSQPGLAAVLANYCHVRYLGDEIGLSECIAQCSPDLICFDFDYPDLAGLKTLRETKRSHPSLPVIMLTEPNSEALAVWALRARVWDYFIKPVAVEELYQRCMILSKVKSSGRHEHREIVMPETKIPAQMRFSGSTEKQVTFPALSYIDRHFPEKVSLNAVAHICGMGPSKFSRAFKREQCMTFRDFLIQRRIDEARSLFRNPNASIIEVAFAVGFNDPSHFTRTFRRHVGVAPSKYRGTEVKVS